MTNGNDVTLDKLNALADRLGENVTHVEDLRRLSGGASQETWSFKAVGSSGKQNLILRRSPFGNADSQAIGLKKEAQILEALVSCNIPAPVVVYDCEPEDEIGLAYIMRAIEGETLPQRIMKDERFAPGRDKIAAQCGTALAKLHTQPKTLFPDLPLAAPDEQIRNYESLLRSNGVERPVFELAIRYLKDNIPSLQETALIHGDFRMGNLMIDENGLSGILDWELCHFGDPREDIGWLCTNSWRFGRRDKRVGGVGDLSELLDAYQAAGGAAITEKDIDFWECLGSLKWGIMCTLMYEAFRNGSDRSIERASIGRRASETEIDLMNILETV